VLRAGEGDDTLIAGAGADMLEGGPGADTLYSGTNTASGIGIMPCVPRDYCWSAPAGLVSCTEYATVFRKLSAKRWPGSRHQRRCSVR
jgi:Ca2+-binding RTX toxin-like protein